MRAMLFRFLIPLVLPLCLIAEPDLAASEATHGPLRVDATNPRYFVDQLGNIVYLTGSHTWQTFKDRGITDPPPPFDFDAYLDFLVAHEHNMFRLWTWEQPRSRFPNPDGLKRNFLPFPWLRVGPGMGSDGKPKFDLNQWDPAYFARMRARVMAARARGVYVAITLFNGYDLANHYNTSDSGFPYATENNVNGLVGDPMEAQTLSDPTVTALQEAYVRRVIDAVNDLDNVLYEIANETGEYGVDWQYHMIDVIKQYEATKPFQHPVGMSVPYPGTDEDVFASDAEWVSPLSRVLESDGSKVVLNDTDHSFHWTVLVVTPVAEHRAWAWKTFTLGAQPMFMDPYLEEWQGRNDPNGAAVDPYWETLRNAMGDTHRYAKRLDLRHAVPSESLCSTNFCLAYPGAQYLVFQHDSGPFSVTLVAGSYNYEWFDPARRIVVGSGSINVASGARTFTPPHAGQAVLLLLPEPNVAAPLFAGVAALVVAARGRANSTRLGAS